MIRIEQVETTGIADIEYGPLKLYPNPASNTLYLELEGAEIHDYLITITDLSGKIIHNTQWLQVPFQGNVVKLDVGRIPSGVYVANIFKPTEQKQIRSAKLVVKK